MLAEYSNCWRSATREVTVLRTGRGLSQLRGDMESSVSHVSIDADQGDRETVYADSVDRRRLDTAINGLSRINPGFSAGAPLANWQVMAGYSGAVLLPAALALLFSGNAGVWAAVLTLPFTFIVLIRIAALWHLILSPRRSAPPAPMLADSGLPAYSVLVPLYRESDVVPALVRALSALDYPELGFKFFS